MDINISPLGQGALSMVGFGFTLLFYSFIVFVVSFIVIFFFSKKFVRKVKNRFLRFLVRFILSLILSIILAIISFFVFAYLTRQPEKNILPSERTLDINR